LFSEVLDLKMRVFASDGNTYVELSAEVYNKIHELQTGTYIPCLPDMQGKVSIYISVFINTSEAQSTPISSKPQFHTRFNPKLLFQSKIFQRSAVKRSCTVLPPALNDACSWTTTWTEFVLANRISIKPLLKPLPRADILTSSYSRRS
jgi:hypothetical protein